MAIKTTTLQSGKIGVIEVKGSLVGGEENKGIQLRQRHGHLDPHHRGPVRCTPTSHRRKIRFGSIRSRRPSPSRVKANAVTRIAIPGKVTTHQEVRK